MDGRCQSIDAVPGCLMNVFAVVRRFVLPTLTVWLCVPLAAQAPRRDGNWEITVDVEIEGLAQKLPSRTTTQCVSPEEAADARKAMPHPGHDPGTLGQCSTSDHKVDGNHVSWSFRCDSPKPVTGTGDIVYVDDSSYSGTIRLVGEAGKTMTMKYTGKRLGDCAK